MRVLGKSAVSAGKFAVWIMGAAIIMAAPTQSGAEAVGGQSAFDEKFGAAARSQAVKRSRSSIAPEDMALYKKFKARLRDLGVTPADAAEHDRLFVAFKLAAQQAEAQKR
ncbi:MAG: hypothetical protein MRY74_00180 [Neomegalonema sp.]|nr:hypothetical protein [Neomegalonema sp.]